MFVLISNSNNPKRYNYYYPKFHYYKIKYYFHYFVKSDKFDIIMKLSLLLCLVGIHQYKIIDVTYGFGASDSIITLECKICGIKKIEKN